MDTSLATLDVAQLPRASFPDAGTFPHFADSTHPGCFACNSRLMLVRPLLVTDEFVVLPATTRLATGDFVVMPDSWLVFPRNHVETLDEMPDDWTASVKQAVRHLRSLGHLTGAFNTGANWGRAAGQTTMHAHTWASERDASNEAGLITEETGLATIIMRARLHGIPMP